MQNPAKEIEEVVRGLVEKPTLKRQAAVLEKYCTEDVEFYHFYIDTKGGVKDLTAIYQMAELIVNYQSAEFDNIVYDRKENALVLRMTVFVRPFGIFPVAGLKFLTILQLQDHRDEHGKTVKKIKVQRDYFERSPLLLMIPIFGHLYDNEMLRTLIGSIQATTFDILRQGFGCSLRPNRALQISLLKNQRTSYHSTVVHLSNSFNKTVIPSEGNRVFCTCHALFASLLRGP